MKRLCFALCMMILVATPMAVPLAAQRRGAGQGQGDQPAQRAELERRVRAQFEQRMREQLGLTEEEQGRLREVVEVARRARMALSRDEQRLRLDMMDALESEDSDEATRLLVETVALARREADLLEQEQAQLLQVLSPVQLLKMNAFRQQMGDRIRGLRAGGRMDGNFPGRGGRGRPGDPRDRGARIPPGWP